MPYGMKLPEAFERYKESKHRRCSLLFSVNGSAFAVAKLFPDPKNEQVFGSLTVQSLWIGMTSSRS